MCVVSFRFGFEVGIWDLVVLVPDHCLSFTFHITVSSAKGIFSRKDFNVICAAIPSCLKE